MKYKMQFLIQMCLLSSCATSSGVISIGKNKFSIYEQGGSSFSNPGAQKVSAMKQAGRFCTEKEKEVEIIEEKLSKPPYILGNYPSAEIVFTCN